MNLCEGRVGRQETTAAAWIACVSAGIFSINTHNSYAAGNAAYAATLIAACVSLGVFTLVAAAMRARGLDTLSGLYRSACGGAGGFAFAFVTALMLLYASVLPLGRILNILCRYLFVESEAGQIVLYFLPVVVILAYMGLETVTRTSRLFALLILLSILLVLVIAMPSYDGYRLYPLLGGSAPRLFGQSLGAMARYLPPLWALLICGRGVQGVKNAAKAAVVALSIAALVAALVQFCEGTAYSYVTLAEIPSSLYRLTSAVRTGNAYLRTDKLLLFFWMVGALLAAAFLCYAASLLYTRASGMRDTRPAAVVFSVLCCTLTLLTEVAGEGPQRVAAFFWNWSWALMAAPPLIAAGIVMLKRRESP